MAVGAGAQCFKFDFFFNRVRFVNDLLTRLARVLQGNRDALCRAARVGPQSQKKVTVAGREKKLEVHGRSHFFARRKKFGDFLERNAPPARAAASTHHPLTRASKLVGAFREAVVAGRREASPSRATEPR